MGDHIVVLPRRLNAGNGDKMYHHHTGYMVT
jgi:hypothetical protein